MSVMEHPGRLLPAVPAARRRRGMSVSEAIRVAFQGLIANKLRSFLTMLGIIIGVCSVIIMVALGQGAANATREAIQKLGTNVLSVVPNSQMRGGVSQGMGTQQNLRLEHVEAIRRACPSLKLISPEYRGNGTVKFQNQNTKTTVYGANTDYFEIRNLPMGEGRIFTNAEIKRKAKVAVIGDQVRENLFGALQPINKYIKLNGQSFQVIGTIKKRGGGGFRNPDDQITIPITTAMGRVFGVDYINSMSVQAVSEEKMIPLEEEIKAVMRRVDKTPAGEEPDIRFFNQADFLETAQQQSSFLTMLLTGVAVVSLIVGGIGIMNIMLVSVTERTREIGIRKAIGAKRKDILYQFLIESVTLSVVGGIIGIGVGIGGSLWMQKPADEGGLGFPMMLSVTPMVVSFVFSALVGIFFGIYPAVKASRLDPIVALRYE